MSKDKQSDKKRLSLAEARQRMNEHTLMSRIEGSGYGQAVAPHKSTKGDDQKGRR